MPNASPIIPVQIPADEHQINIDAISTHALTVIDALLKAGHQAYLVGGCIRDLLLGMKPKDFDISTSAHPEEVLKLFKKARIIGRRFRIVHVYFGREILEITTFRGGHPDNANTPHSSRSDSGQLLRDNIFGSFSEDALRRDFTANALYYDIKEKTIIDYVQGYQDIQQGLLRVIGDPEQRYREDPIRMLRAIRFSGKLNFLIDPGTAAPIHELIGLLANIPSARLFDESLKIFLSGYGSKTLPLAIEYGLFDQLYPITAEHMGDSFTQKMITCSLRNTDQRLANGKHITPAFFYAVVLWPAVQKAANHHRKKMPEIPALHRASQEVISAQIIRTSIPKRFSIPMKEIWSIQLSLPRRNGKRAERLLSHPRFRAAYDFLLLLEECGEQTGELGEWWTKFQSVNGNGQQDMVKALASSGKQRKKYLRKPK